MYNLNMIQIEMFRDQKFGLLQKKTQLSELSESCVFCLLYLKFITTLLKLSRQQKGIPHKIRHQLKTSEVCGPQKYR